MVAGGEYQAEKRLVSLAAQVLVRLQKQIFIRNTPGGHKLRVFKVFLIDNGLKTIIQKETPHIVKMSRPTVDEAGMEILFLQHTGDGEEVGLRFCQLHGTAFFCGRKTRDYCLESTHRTRAGGIKLFEPYSLICKSVEVWSQVLATKATYKFRTEALLQYDHEIHWPTQTACGHLVMHRGCVTL